MRKIILLIITIPFLSVISNCQINQNDFPVLKGPYLGQTPPGTTPEIFAPGIISLDNYVESNCVFWNEGKHLLFTRIEGTASRIMETELINGSWTPLRSTNLFGHDVAFEPGITPDGKKIFFNCFKEKPQNAVNSTITWIVEKNNNKFSEPYYSEQGGMFPSVDRYGNIYATGRKDGKSCIVRFIYDGTKYLSKEILPSPVFSKYQDMHPCISPDGSYLLYDSDDRRGLFLSFKLNDEKWSEPVNLSEHWNINGGLARISSDGKYIFFQAEGNIYWVSTKIIDELKPKDL